MAAETRRLSIPESFKLLFIVLRPLVKCPSTVFSEMFISSAISGMLKPCTLAINLFHSSSDCILFAHLKLQQY